MHSVIIDHQQVKSFNIGALGGKGRNLHILMDKDIPVPKWFCVPSSVYCQHIELIADKIRFILAQVNYEDYFSIQKASNEIQTLVEGETLHSKISKEINGKLSSWGDNKLYAVRSSAVEEDSVNHSFAGLFDTFLYVPIQLVIPRIINCWSSIFSNRALSYCYVSKKSPIDVKMSVIVQEMIKSTKSGVLFQANPVGKLEELVIVAGYGLGEGIVSNQVETDTFYYDQMKKTLKTKINEKKTHLSYDFDQGSGVKSYEVPESDKSKPVLSQSDLDRIIGISNNIEKIYDQYQDVEWTINENNEIFVLQSRPITTLPPGKMNIYDNTNISENYPGITSPLTYSIVKHFYKQAFINTYNRVGFTDKFVNSLDECFSNMINLIQGRIYYNITNWCQAYSLISDNTFTHFENMIGAKKSNISEKIKTDFFTRQKVFVIRIWSSIIWTNKFKRYKKQFEKNIQDNRRLLHSKQYRNLVEMYLKVTNDYWNLINIPSRNDFYVMTYIGTAKKELKRLMPEEDNESIESILNTLLVGNKGIKSIDPLVSIIKMADMVRSSEKLKNRLIEYEAFNNTNLIHEFKDFYGAFMNHLNKYGDRGPLELKLECKSFRQRPEELIKIILEYADSGLAVEDIVCKRANTYDSAVDKINEKLNHARYVDKLRVRYLLKKVNSFVRYRESARLDRTRFYGLIREILLSIAALWQNQRVLDNEEDIFYLTIDEILENVESPNGNQIRDIISTRKKEWVEYNSFEPVDRMLLIGDVTRNYIPQKEQKEFNASDHLLRGLGCCPGTVSGEAIVLKSPISETVIKDRILVALNTDPGWVFWIMASKGLIVEKGNMLSHTAIIGRELGKPTIVCVADATKIIPPNAWVTMDGQKGTIQIGTNRL